MSLDVATFRDLVAEASLAPSVHNTQPTRWRLTPEGEVLVLEDPARRLPVGDPEGRDLGVSHGCAVEGFRIAAARVGLTVTVHAQDGAVARLTTAPGSAPDPLAGYVLQRRTWRGRFDTRRPADAALDAVQDDLPDAVLVRDAAAIDEIATLYDEASLRWFRNAPYRAELLSWMRLSRRHPGWPCDGLNAEAMEMSAVEALGAGLALRPGMFEVLDRVGLAGPLVAEASVVRTAAALALFHRPADETPLETGHRFYRLWLTLTRDGLAASPMAVLADDPAARSALTARYYLPPQRRLITVFRLGFATRRPVQDRPRLPLDTLIV